MSSQARSAAYTDRRDWATVNANLLANLTDELREAFEGYYAKGDLARQGQRGGDVDGLCRLHL